MTRRFGVACTLLVGAACAGGRAGSPIAGGAPAPVAVAAGAAPADATRGPFVLPERRAVAFPRDWRFPADPARTVTASSTMVVSNSREASTAGDEMLRRGGNAVDAAVAVGFALAVTHPIAGNIGGGGFMVIQFADGRSAALDFRETAPRAATRNMFLDANGEPNDKSRHGHLASGVPGSVAGLTEALAKYGTMSLHDVMQPAIRLAEEGYAVDAALSSQIGVYAARLKQYGVDHFFANGMPLATGAVLRQPDLARTLRRIADGGARAFYTGETADLIVAEMHRGGGIITKADLAAYRAIWREPLRGRYRGYSLITMPPPSSGGVVVLETLNILEGFGPLPAFASTAYTHAVAEAFRRAFVDRNTLLGDPDFVTMPISRMTSKGYGDSLRRTIDPLHATATQAFAPKAEGVHTTHYAVVDFAGNAVSTTTTINDFFGSKVMVHGAGFFLNDEMDDFAAAPGKANLFGHVQGESNAIQPAKRMLSSMSPTIVLDSDGKFLLAVGAAGGSRIITAVTQVLLNVLEHRMALADALAAPRIHHQAWPDELWYESRGLSVPVRDSLVAFGHLVVARDSLANAMGIMRVAGGVQGVPEPRREGAAVGH